MTSANNLFQKVYTKDQYYQWFQDENAIVEKDDTACLDQVDQD